MFLKAIQLVNFRNYERLDLEFDRVTLLIGDNAQGKSNVLEAIYFLATTKSSRVEKDLQLIKQGEEYTTLEAEIEEREKGEGGRVKLQIGMQLVEGNLSKKLQVNGVARRTVDYIGNLVVVFFAPEDINLVTGSPSLRRWHIDLTLAQVDREYKRAITEYSEVVTARNRILKRIKEGLGRLDELDFWTDKLLINGQIVSQKRQEFFEFLNTNTGVEFKYLYQPSELNPDRLKEYQTREVASASSLIGPHRDDFEFQLNNQPLAVFGSRGEQRTAVLDLKLLELRYISQRQNLQPILLLDDVFSELDDSHRQHVIEVTKNQQTVISAVANENIPDQFLKQVKLVRVESGVISSQT